jgi:hypothetical protein
VGQATPGGLRPVGVSGLAARLRAAPPLLPVTFAGSDPPTRMPPPPAHPPSHRELRPPPETLCCHGRGPGFRCRAGACVGACVSEARVSLSRIKKKPIRSSRRMCWVRGDCGVRMNIQVKKKTQKFLGGALWDTFC